MSLKKLIFFAAIISFYSCQDVIEVELKNTQIKPVIVGSISDVDTLFEVSLTTSAEFYDTKSASTISGAIITISDENGNKSVLQELSDGKYIANDYLGIRGSKYSLEVDIDGKGYFAEASIPSRQIFIDSIVFKYQAESIFQDEGIYPVLYYTDPMNERNYYRIKATVNGLPFDYNRDTPEEKPDIDTQIKLYSDKFTDGGVQDYDLGYNLVSGDVLRVEFQHLDEKTYDYLRTLNGVAGASGVAPADPLSNFGNDALGYFGAFNATFFEIIVP